MSPRWLGRARRFFGLAWAVTEWRRGANRAIEAVLIANRNKDNMAEGTIKRLTDRGFGFIETSPGNDIFFHMSNVEDGRTPMR